MVCTYDADKLRELNRIFLWIRLTFDFYFMFLFACAFFFVFLRSPRSLGMMIG